MIVVDAYHRRRGWLAFHSGGAAMGKNLKLSDFTGQTTAAKPQTPEQMAAVVAAALAKTARAEKAKAKD